MRDLYVLFATQRSGHHGVLNWICSQHGSITHYNDAKLSEDRLSLIPNRPEGVTHYGDTPTYALLVNLEVSRLSRWADEDWGATKIVTEAGNIQPVLVIRRFRNWLASTACHPGNSCMVTGTVTPEMELKWANKLQVYRDHLDAACGLITPFPNLVVIRFDSWFSSAEYREQLAEQLGIPFTDAGLNDVPRFASGSTFDLRTYDGKAQSMGVLDRWRQAEDSSLYQDLLRDSQDLDDRSEQYFATT